MKRAKERGLEPLRGLWWVEQSKGKLTKRPTSRQHRPLRNNSSNRKRKQEPRTNRVSTPSNEHFLHAWTLANTRSSDSLGLSPGKRLTGPGIFLLLYKIPQCKPAIGFVEQSNFKRLEFDRSEEHTSELQSRLHLVCRLLLEKKNTSNICSSHVGYTR